MKAKASLSHSKNEKSGLPQKAGPTKGRTAPAADGGRYRGKTSCLAALAFVLRP